MLRRSLLALCAPLSLSLAAAAGPLAKDKVPDPLKSWIPWALHGHDAQACPAFLGGSTDDDDADAPGCRFVSTLALVLDGKSGRFTQTVRLYADGMAPLPGSPERWPLEVKVDGKPGAVIANGDVPSLWLPAGEHAVSGAFFWSELPESIEVPFEAGLVTLTLRGKPVPFPVREDNGLLWLQREGESDATENRLDLTVSRRFTDDVPLLVNTRIKLDVSGKNREVLLGRALLDGFVPLALEGPLPARLEPDGRLRVQVRPGSFTLEVWGRRDGPVQKLTSAAQPEGALWPPEEIWVLEAKPELRVVEVQGLAQIDSAQTTLSSDWKHLPAWRVRPGESLELVEQRRGDKDPAPDKLDLNRTLWLDFDGKGVTALDTLSGTLSRSWRLEMPEPSKLGRVTIGGHDQLITRTSDSGAPGVEVREGQLQLVAQSRVEQGGRSFPAVGWGHDLNSLTATLHLPPGWRLLHAGGVDDASQTWLQHWSLLDLFVVLMVALAVARLFGVGFGVLAFVALALSLPEGAPRWTWLIPLAAEGLLRVVPKGQLLRVLAIGRCASWVVLLLALVPFAARHVRSGMYPALGYRIEDEGPDSLEQLRNVAGARASALAAQEDTQAVAPANAPVMQMAPPSSPPPPHRKDGSKHPAMKSKAKMLANAEGDAEVSFEGGVVGGVAGGQVRSTFSKAGKTDPYVQRQLQQIDPNAVVQTGTGIPAWAWRAITLRWSGPVERSAQLSLWLLGPAVNMVLAFLRVLLLAALFGLFVVRRFRSGGTPAPLMATIPAAIALFLIFAPNAARAGELPSEELLNELRGKLLEQPVCAPNCADNSKLTLEASGAQLKLKLEIAAAAVTVVPLPGGLTQWMPERVLLDGAPAKALRRAGDSLWVAVPEGVHTVELSGALPGLDSVQLPLSMRPRRVEAHLDGWTLDGIHEDGTAEESLQLTRKQHGAAPGKLEPGQLPPFASVTRTLVLGLTWEVETRVERRSPAANPVVLEVPLLPGESITSAAVHSEKGKALVTLSPRTPSVSWHSVLSEAPALTLTAPEGTAWSETWVLEISPVWHVEATGLAPVLAQATTERPRIFRPYPGEKLTLAISRPAAAPGQSLTVQSSHLEITPGARASDVTLELKLSGSRGGPFTITLPESALVQSLTLDGATQPLRQDGRKATITLPPGEHRLLFSWREPIGLSLVFHTPQVDLGVPSVNASVGLKLPYERWTLLLGGPRLGPAVLFWSLLLVLVLLGAALARIELVPLKTLQWVLLAIGLTQVELIPAALVAGWLLALGWRRVHGQGLSNKWVFDLGQLVLLAWTLAAFGILFEGIHRGLLGAPDMQVAGNGSSAQDLRWFTDRAQPELPRAWALSVPLMIYRGAMLAWALWLASSLVRWLPWAWGGFSMGGLWRTLRVPKKKAAEPVTPQPG